MKLAVFVTAVCVAVPSMSTAQTPRNRAPQPAPAPPAKVAQAYEQFLIGHHLEENDDVNGAIAAYKKAIELDPLAADIPAELAGLYLRHDRVDDAMAAAEQALKIAPANRRRTACSVSSPPRRSDSRGAAAAGAAPTPNVTNAIQHLEKAIAEPDRRSRSERARERSPGFTCGSARTTRRFRSWSISSASSRRGWTVRASWPRRTPARAEPPTRSICWMSRRMRIPACSPRWRTSTSAQERWKDAANAYARALNVAPRNVDLKTRYAPALLNAGGRDNIGKARDALNDIVSTRNDARALYLLSQAERRFGDFAGAEAAARRVIACRTQSPWGYFALAEALEEGRQYAQIVDALDAGDCEIPRAVRRSRRGAAHAAAASGFCLSGARPVRQGVDRLRRSASPVAERRARSRAI